MPYISDFGAQPWAEVINQTGNGIRGSLAGYQQRQDQVDAEDKATAEQNRILHPAAQKWLKEVVSGRVDPVTAAARAHDEIDAGNNSYGGGGKLMDEGDQGNVDPNMAYARPYTGAAPTGLRAGSVESLRTPMPERSFTVRDMNDIGKISEMQRNARPPTDQMAIELARERARADNTKTTEEGKNSRAGAENSRKWVADLLRYNAAMARIRMEAEKVSQLTGAQRDIEAAKLLVSMRNARESNEGKIASSIMNDTDPAQGVLKEIALNARNEEAQILSMLKQPIPAPGTPGSPRAGPEYRPNELGNAPSPETPPIPGSGEEQGKTVIVPVPKSMPQAPTTKRVGSKQEKIYSVKFPDGSTHPVPESKLPLAKQKGGMW